MRSIICLVLLAVLVVVSPLHAQRRKPKKAASQQPAHQLLWEISGNGLEKPSYLYGTMHVQDRRAFEFSDSVLVKFHGCTAFAAEIRIDSAVRDLMQQLLHDKDSAAAAEGFDDTPMPEDASTDTTTLEIDAATPMPDDTMSVAPSMTDMPDPDADTTFPPPVSEPDPDSVTDKGAPDSDAEPTYTPPVIEADSAFVTYEALPEENQADSNPDTGDAVTEHDDYSTPQHSRLRDNPLMSDLFTGETPHRITDKPAFLDAYLTGLAQREGKDVIGLETMAEQLEAAKSLSSMMAESYQPRRRAHALTGAYPDDMFSYYRAGNLDKMSALLHDLLSPGAYTVMIVQRNHRMAERADKLIRKQPTFIAIGAGHLPGKEGVIALLRERGYTVRAVKATFTGLAGQYVLPPRFTSWASFTSGVGAYTAQMPMDPITLPGIGENDENSEAFRRSETDIWPDLLTGIQYSVNYSDYSLYTLVREPATVLRDAYHKQSSSSLRTVVDPVPIVVDSLPGLEFTTKEGDGKFHRTRLLLRGTRLYTLTVESTREMMTSGDAEQFFASFHPAEFKEGTWRADTIKGCDCEVMSPGAFQKIPGEYEYRGNTKTYLAFDDNSGLGYSVNYKQFSDYYQARNEDSVFAAALGRQGSYRDSIQGEKIVTRNGVAGHEFELHSNGYGLRARMVLAGNRLITIRVEMPVAMLHAPVVDRYFDSFHVIGDTAQADLYSDKSARLFADLLSADTAVATRARRAAEDYPFTVEQLPRLYDVVRHVPPGDAVPGVETRSVLLNQLGTLHDENTVRFIREQYPLIGDDAHGRYAALRVLADIGTNESMAAFSDLILHDSVPVANHSYRGILYSLSIDNAARIFPAMPALLKSSKNRDAIYYLMGRLLDSGRIVSSALLPFAPDIIHDCDRALRQSAERSSYADEVSPENEDSTTDEGDEPGYLVERLQAAGRLLGYLPYTPVIDSLLRGLMAHDDEGVNMVGVRAYLRQSGTPPAKVLEKLAAGKSTRIPLYQTLNLHGRLELFPQDYRNQKAFAESLLSTWLDDDDTYADTLEYVAQHVITTGDHPGRVYLFKYRTDDEAEWMVGISGTQPLDEQTVNTSVDRVRTKYEAFDSKTVDEHFNTLMKDDGK